MDDIPKGTLICGFDPMIDYYFALGLYCGKRNSEEYDDAIYKTHHRLNEQSYYGFMFLPVDAHRTKTINVNFEK